MDCFCWKQEESGVMPIQASMMLAILVVMFALLVWDKLPAWLVGKRVDLSLEDAWGERPRVLGSRQSVQAEWWMAKRCERSSTTVWLSPRRQAGLEVPLRRDLFPLTKDWIN
jgi:hypothetical protein